MAELGHAAVELAIALIEHGGEVQPRQVFQPALAVRDSTGPAVRRVCRAMERERGTERRPPCGWF